MKFGQLIEYNMRNIFLEKSYTKCGGETIPRPFLKIKIEHISGSIAYNYMQVVLIACHVEEYCSILKLNRRPFAFTSYKNFMKNKEFWN